MNTTKIRNIYAGVRAVLLFCLTFAFMISLFEVFFYYLDSNDYIFIHPDVLESHPILGADNKSNVQEVCEIQLFDKTFREKTYTIKDGIRVTPGNEDSKKKFIAVFGCSGTFGWGCNDDETFPARLGHYLPEYNIYNFGVCSSATQHMYWKIKSGKVKESIKEEEGLGVYVFFGFHPARVAMSLWTFYAYGFPDYQYNSKTDDLDYIGSIGNLHPYQKFIYSILRKSNTLQHYKFHFPFYSKALIDKCIDQLRVSKKYFVNAFDKARFIVFIPSTKQDFPKMDYFITRLQQEYIEYFVCSPTYFNTLNSMDKKTTKYPDGHYTPVVQDMMAREFCDNLNN